jgi:hypothetical protein
MGHEASIAAVRVVVFTDPGRLFRSSDSTAAL